MAVLLVGEVAGGVDVGQLPLADPNEPPGHVGIIWIKPPLEPVVLPGYTGSDRNLEVLLNSKLIFPAMTQALFRFM